jgi:hypothetical protein
MRLTRSKKWLATAAGVVTVGVAATAAFAYFTTTGSGEGTATVGSSSAVTLYGTTDTTLYPGTSGTVSFTVDNSSPGHQWIGTITLDSVSTDAAHSTCDTDDFTMADVDASQDVDNGDGIAITATGTLEMANTAVSQNGCEGAPLTLHLSSN